MAGTVMHPYHQQLWPPAAAPPPQTPAHPQHSHPPLTKEVRTIFLSGLPEDIKERELQMLLRWLPGFVASQVNFKGEPPLGLAPFSTPQFAIAAPSRSFLNGTCTDSHDS